jgi:hypothetical protein
VLVAERPRHDLADDRLVTGSFGAQVECLCHEE